MDLGHKKHRATESRSYPAPKSKFAAFNNLAFGYLESVNDLQEVSSRYFVSLGTVGYLSKLFCLTKIKQPTF